MKHILAFVCLTLASSVAAARPIPINESARIVAPAPFDARNAAIDGDSILVTAHDWVGQRDALLHYRRSGAGWQLAGQLLLLTSSQTPLPLVAAEEGVAAVQFDGRLYVFERSGATWIAKPVVQPAEELVTSTLEIDAGRIVVGVSRCSQSSAIFGRSTTGVYVQTGLLPGAAIPGCSSTAHAGGDLSGEFAASHMDGSVWVYRRNALQADWPIIATIPRRNSFNGSVQITWPFVIVGGYEEQIVYRGGLDEATQVATVSPLGRDHLQATAYSSRVRDGLLLVNHNTIALGAEIYAYRGSPDGTYSHVAIAKTTDGLSSSLYRPDVSGRTIVSQGWGGENTPSTIYVFELPEILTTPAPLHDDFQGTGAAEWNPRAGSQLAVVASGHSRVYRQSSLVADSGALLAGTDWRNHAVQADIKPIQFDAGDRWAGLVARWQDAQNFYYVTLRSSNRVSLRKMVDGVITELATAPLAVVPGRTYRVRLETRGAELRASVDGVAQLLAVDRDLEHGLAGFSGYRARYDVDNFHASPLATTLSRAEGAQLDAGNWTFRGSQWNVNPFPEPYYLSQPETGISGHAVIGKPTDDQIALARTRVDAFSATTTAGWVGVTARYVDNANYYSLSLRSNHSVQLRRTVNGVVTVLAGRSLTVTPGQFYDLRLDAVGGRLRAYVDGVLRLEADDASLPVGRAGLATYKAAASFASFEAYQP